MAETLLMKNVKYLVTCDDNDRFMTDINMLVTDGVITYIGTEEKTADKIIDASRMVVYPGLINSHHHYIKPSQEIFHRYKTWNSFHG